MSRFLALAFLVLGLNVWAQNPPPQMPVPDGVQDPNTAGTDEQKCMNKCGQAMNACMMPCTGGNPSEAAKPENRGKMMACVKKCADGQAPCMNACKKKKAK